METEMTNWIDNVWPKFLDAGLSIVWAVILLIIGIKVINVARKLLKSALERSNIDTGVVQFLDAFVKFVAYAVLIPGTVRTFWSADNFFYYYPWFCWSSHWPVFAGQPVQLCRRYPDSDSETLCGGGLCERLWL